MESGDVQDVYVCDTIFDSLSHKLPLQAKTILLALNHGLTYRLASHGFGSR